MCAMRPLRNFKTNQCCHLISRIANRAFFLNDEEKTRFVERLWRVAAFSCVEVLASSGGTDPSEYVAVNMSLCMAA